ncbi:COX15/CtaA family protein [Porticoccus sp.]|uniref:COX15/CtaA family protein n=1 Tax=Porticoccus sp. TaxID=2024853 RepID=UPI003F69706E
MAVTATALSIAVLILGVFTRLTDAGLSCPDWPGCYGHFSWLTDPDAIARAERLYPDNPIEQQKTVVDMVHRYTAGVLGILAIALAVISWLRREDEAYPFRLPTFILFLMVWQSLFGMWSVTLQLWPQIVSLHLLTGMVTCSLLWLLTLRLSGREWRLSPDVMGKLPGVKSWLLAVITVTLLQILLGGWTSANYAAFACTEFPTCQGQWWPEMDFKNGFNLTQTIGPNYLGGKLEGEARVAIHVMHRLGGLIVGLLMVGLAVRLFTIKSTQFRCMALIMLAILTVQITLGVSNVFLMSPLLTALMHHLGSVLLMLVLVTLGARTWTARLE